MSRRDGLFAFGALVVAVVVTGLLLVGAMATIPDRPGELRPRVFFGDRSPPAGRTIEQIQERVPPAARPFVPLTRGVAAGFADAAGYVLLLIGVSGTLVFAREQVLASYRTSLGGWRVQLRTLGLGTALLVLIASASFLAFVALLGSLAGPGPTRGGFPFQPLLQIGVSAVSVVIVLVGIVALVGFTAAAWRLGDALLALRPLARFGQRVPAPLVALLGATIVYLLAQLPAIGVVVVLAALAYALGSVVGARLAHVRGAAAP